MFEVKIYPCYAIATWLLLLAPISSGSPSGCQELSVNHKRTYGCTGDLQNFNWRQMPGEGIHFILKDLVYPEDVFTELVTSHIVDNIVSVKVTDSNLKDVPYQLYELKNIENIEITNNEIAVIHFNMLSGANNLAKFNVSNNRITELDQVVIMVNSTKKLEIIDLSHNSLTTIPDNCFSVARDSLEILDLSFNLISSFGTFSFDHLPFLRQLSLSNNKIAHIGLTFFPLKGLNELFLDHNQLTALDNQIFTQTVSLVNLDLSSNNISLIENLTFDNLSKLRKLDLSDNNISSIKKILFRNNPELLRVDLSNNEINYVENKAFAFEKTVSLDLEKSLVVSIEPGMFEELKAFKLNLSGGKILRIGNNAFKDSHYLVSLNVSSCGIQHISEKAFEPLVELRELDLSNNNLTELALKTKYLKSLSRLYFRNNLIREIKTDDFNYLRSLTILDLSYNQIVSINSNSFHDLINLKILKLHDNPLISTGESNIFNGLEKVPHFGLVNTKLSLIDNYEFVGMRNLEVLNVSHGEIFELSYYAFSGIDNIIILDLSYNNLTSFQVDITSLANVKEIHLNNNFIKTISSNSFNDLTSLQTLNLFNNNLLKIYENAFQTLKSLKLIDLSYNYNLELYGKVFENLNLRKVSLSNVRKQIRFDSVNTSISEIDVSNCLISNLTDIKLFNIRNLQKLDLNTNNITNLNINTFKSMPSLSWLDLSNNQIEYIQPGTFLNTSMIGFINLNNNSLSKLQFGAFSGLVNLIKINISNNFIQVFKGTDLYYLPSVKYISLDNNEIRSFKLLNLLAKSSVERSLSIGGNPISCDYLAELKIIGPKNIKITADELDYYSENVDGIKCGGESDVWSPSSA